MAQSKEQIGIVAAQWHSKITDKMLEGALKTLKSNGYHDQQIVTVRCPGTFEIPAAAQMMLPSVAGVVAIGAVVRGETPHFDYICEAVSNGIMQLNIKYNKPVTFGVLTTDTMQQAAERSTEKSKFGNKGIEAADALIEMLSLNKDFKEVDKN